jgi:hypothetical protein
MTMTLTRRGLLIGGLALTAAGCAAPQPSGAPRPSRAPGLPEAVIGFDMWVGQPGVSFGDSVDVMQGSRRIHGPIDWRHPVTGERLKVYARVNRDRAGERLQYFTMRPDGAALARVYDRRPGAAERTFVGDAFFPVGLWRRGESREFRMVEHSGGGVETPLRVTLTVIDPSREFRDVPGSMRYDWIARDPAGAVLFHERFDYSPGVGFVRFDNRLN